jgi:hypothetical protein
MGVTKTESDPNKNVHYIGKHVYLAKSKLTEDEITKIKETAIYQCLKQNYKSKKLPRPQKMWQMTKTHYVVPHYYGLTHFTMDRDDRVSNIVDTGRWMGHDLEEEERKQVSAYNAVQTAFAKTGYAFLGLPPGGGKTTVAMKTFHEYKQKTLFVCHADLIWDQSIKNIKLACPDVQIGKIRGKECDTKDKQIVITTIQSLMKPGKYPEHIFEEFGLIIIDEAHRTV